MDKVTSSASAPAAEMTIVLIIYVSRSRYTNQLPMQ
jgi:hypothetical protein